MNASAAENVLHAPQGDENESVSANAWVVIDVKSDEHSEMLDYK